MIQKYKCSKDVKYLNEFLNKSGCFTLVFLLLLLDVFGNKFVIYLRFSFIHYIL